MSVIKRDYNYNSLLIHSFSPGKEKEIKDKNNLKYHYTSPEALLSILKGKTIHFTDIRFLNDKSEDIYLVKLMLDVLDENKNAFPTVHEMIYELLKNNNIDELRNLGTISINYNTSLKYIPIRKFVFCTTTDGDLLNMWNYYVKNGNYQGYNIGFNIEKLLKTFDTQEPHTLDPFEVLYGKVIYEPKKQKEEILSFFEKTEMWYTTFNEPFNHLVIDIRRYIDKYGAFFKNPSFASEKEYRVCIEIDDKRLKDDKENYFGINNKEMKYDFRASSGLMVPYIEIKLNDDSISRINISPMMEFDIAKESLRELLDVKGYKNVQIHKSRIPVRF